MTIQRFEDLECWKSARTLVHEIYQLTRSQDFTEFKHLRWQLQSAALSSMNNIAEGFDRFSPKERMLFFNYSTGSAGEVRSMLYTCLDLEVVASEQFDALMDQAKRTQLLTVGLIRYLRKRQSST